MIRTVGCRSTLGGEDLKFSDLIFMTLENSTVFEIYDDVAARFVNALFGIAYPPADIYNFSSPANADRDDDCADYNIANLIT